MSWARPRTVLFAVVLAIGFAGLSALDARIYHLIDPSLASRERLDSQLWYHALRNIGALWTWLALGSGLLVVDQLRARGAKGRAGLRGAYIAGSAGLAGLLAELLKLVIARERPASIEQIAGGVEALVYHGHRFRGLFAGFTDGSNLGLPSSHAATAAGGAFALALLWPRLWPLSLAASLGCALTRVLTGAHFATDVYAGIVLGWLVARALRGSLPPRRPGVKPA